MIDPNDAACSPAACLWAEAAHLRSQADEAQKVAAHQEAEADRLRNRAQTHTAEAQAQLALAVRYESAAQLLDQAADKTEAPFLAEG